MTQITAVRCALPPYRHRQAELTSMFGELNAVEPGRRPLLERLHANAGVDTRHTLVECLQSGSVAGYEQAWRRVSRKSRLLTAGLLWSRHRSLLAPHIVPAAEHFPRLFTSIVNHVAAA